MQANDLGQQKSGPRDADETHHLVCHQCEHETLHGNWGDAMDDARDHCGDHDDHRVSIRRVAP